MRRASEWLLAVLLCSLPAFGQQTLVRYDNVALSYANIFGTKVAYPLSFASVRVCTASGNGTPCTPLATVYQDAAGVLVSPNPLSSDVNGNYGFYAYPGRYVVQISSAGVLVYTMVVDIPLAASDTGTVKSVGLSAPPELSISGSPITTTGTIALSWAPENANQVFAGPASGGAATPSFRALVGNDIPPVNLAAGGNGGVTGILPVASGGTGASTSAGALVNLNAAASGSCPSGQVVTAVSSAGPTCVPAGAAKPQPSDAIQYVSPNGNDSNDGLSWGTAKATLFAAYQALPSTGGVIFVSAGANCGGPNNALWVAGPLGGEPQWNNGAGNISAGWLPQKNGFVRIVGVTGNQAIQNASPGGTPLNCSQTQPQIWISGVGVSSGLTFENLSLSSQTTIVQLAVSSASPTASTGANNIRFYNCHLGISPSSTNGPVVNIGSNAFWIWFIGGGMQTSSNSPVDSDARMAMVLNPHQAANTDIGLIFLYDMNIDGGGIHLYNDAANDPHGNMSFYANNVFFEGLCTQRGAIWINDNQLNNVVLDRINVADSCSQYPNTPAVYVGGNKGASVVDRIEVQNSSGDSTYALVGPAQVTGLLSQRFTADPMGSSQWGLFGWHIYAQTDAARRLFGPVLSRFTNLAPQNPADWCWTCAFNLVNGTDYQLNIADPTGGTGAARMLNRDGQFQIARGNRTMSVGDYMVAGIWLRATGTGAGIAAGNSPEPVDLVVNGCSAVYVPNGGTMGQAAVKGNQDWHWVWNIVRITNNGTGTCDVGMSVGSWGINGFDAFGPVFLVIPASSGVTDTEAVAIAMNMSTFGYNLPAGTLATVPRHPIALAGSGDDYFAILDHSALTSNQTYTLPASGGTICVTPSNSCGAITATSISLNTIYVLAGSNFATISGSGLTANPTLTLPSSSGTLCVSSAPCGIATTVNWASVSIQANSCSAQQFTVTGATQGQAVVASPPSDIGSLVWTAAIVAADTLRINMCNPTTAAITAPAVTFTVRVLP